MQLEALGTELDPERPEAMLGKLGALARMIGATLRNTANPTMLDAGYKVNVIPQTATAHVDGRFLPGYEEEFLAELDRVLGPASPGSSSTTTSRWRPPSTATWSTR